MLLKLYLTISIISTILSILAIAKLTTSAKFKEYKSKAYSITDKTITKRDIISTLQFLMYAWIPIFNVVWLLVYFYFVFLANDYEIIKWFEKTRRKKIEQNKEIEKIIDGIKGSE